VPICRKGRLDRAISDEGGESKVRISVPQRGLAATKKDIWGKEEERSPLLVLGVSYYFTEWEEGKEKRESVYPKYANSGFKRKREGKQNYKATARDTFFVCLQSRPG